MAGYNPKGKLCLLRTPYAPMTAVADPILDLVLALPGEDDLPWKNEDRVDSWRHELQRGMLSGVARRHFRDMDWFVASDMGVYFSLAQIQGRQFRAPDFFVVRDVEMRARKSWIVWNEGRGPEIVIEVLSESTAAEDRGPKRQVYQDELRVPEYFLFDLETDELQALRLVAGRYVPIERNALGGYSSQVLGLDLVLWTGRYEGLHGTWVRFAYPDGSLIPTPQEAADTAEEQTRAAQEQARAALEQARAAEEQVTAAEAHTRAAEEQTRAAEDRAARLEALLVQMGRNPDEIS